MKIGIVVPYFGKLPSYFDVFLKSCSFNQSFDWIIISNDNTKFLYPENVHFINMTFEECKNIVQSKFEFEIKLSSPQKLCDYKCAYGYIFERYLDSYDWWGYCDLDQIFGDLSVFIDEELLNKYDRLFSLGHLTLYKNTKLVNSVFMNPLKGRLRYKEVFQTDKCCAFDEWSSNNVNEIFIDSGLSIELNNVCADINPYSSTFRLLYYDTDERKYYHDSVKNSIFEWNNGHIYQLYLKDNCLVKKEYPYVHLQKRKIKDVRTNTENQFYIIPNKFINFNKSPKIVLRQCLLLKIFNIQFFRVKFKSLKYRIKNKNWSFKSVLK